MRKTGADRYHNSRATGPQKQREINELAVMDDNAGARREPFSKSLILATAQRQCPMTPTFLTAREAAGDRRYRTPLSGESNE
jgi:hypothetical protein